MSLNNISTLVVLLNPDSAHISQIALNDKRLNAQLLGLLLYLCNLPDERTPVRQVVARFSRERTWWHRNFKKLEKYGYAKYNKKSKGKNVFEQVYIVSDDPDFLIDFDVTNLKPQRTSERPSLPVQPSQPEPETIPIIPNKHFANKKERVRQQMRWIDPLLVSEEDYTLQQFYLEHNFPIPDDPIYWEEAKKAGMQLWAEIARSFPGWFNASLINKILGSTPNRKAFQIAWEKWVFHGFKPGNAKGITDWYTDLNIDIKAEPWNKNKWSESKNGTGHKRYSKKSRKEHGLSKAGADDDAQYIVIE